MEHNDIRHRLSDYIDGSITIDEKTAIEEHLKTCTACSDALRELQKTIEHIKTVEEVDPPAWMTQKIMAKVRTEAEEKRGLVQRLFSPLSIKLPIQTVAVLFLAVTAFYIYRSIEPSQKLSEAPTQKSVVKNEAPTASAAKSEQKITRDTSLPAKRVPQSPEYKALDMKMEYEKPAPPVPEGQAAASVPAPAKPVEQPMPAKKEAALERRAIAPQAGAPAIAEKGSAGIAPQAEVKLKSAASARQALKAVPADKAGPLIIVRVKDIEAAAKVVEQAITQLGGSVVRKENPEEKKILIAVINAQKLPDLKDKLKLIGGVKDEAAALAPQDTRVELRIELVTSAAQP